MTRAKGTSAQTQLRNAKRAFRQQSAEQQRKLFLAWCDVMQLPAPVPEYPFAQPEREWRFDWAWPDIIGNDGPFVQWSAPVALEVEGGIYGKGPPCPVCKRRPGGAHGSITGIKRDIEKYNRAAVLGWRVLRVTPEHLKTLETATMLREVLYG